jgi:hypothetical protein
MNMHNRIRNFFFAPLLACAFALPACDLDVPNLNNLDLEEFENAPTAPTLNEAAVGLLIATRTGKAGGNGLVSILGIIGRESYNFDAADPRYTTEFLEAPELNPGNGAFGGNFWVAPYRNVRNTFVVENALDSVPGLSDEDVSATRGFAKTIRALEFLTIVTTHWEVDVPIDVNRGINDELAPLVSRDLALEHIATLLDEAQTDLAAAGNSFPFPLSSGFDGFDTPAMFALFNRGVRARVAAYQEDWAGVMSALDDSFLTEDAGAFDAGVYHVYSTGAGDVTNGLSSPNLYVHPAVLARAEPKANGDLDDRVQAKVLDVDPASVTGSLGNYTSSWRFAAYQSNVAPIPIIRNEELILLRAEASIGMGDYPAARDDLNFIRTNSGGLEPIPMGMLDASNAVDELLQQRFYSLLFEGGHRWIDMRRYDRLGEFANDDENPGQSAHSTFPIPLSETDARQ